MLIAAVVTDVAVLGAIHLVARAGAATASTSPPVPGGAPVVTDGGRFAQAPPAAWARCLEGKDHAPPSLVAITYLDHGRDGGVTLGDVRGWIGKLAPASVQLAALDPRDPRMGRRIALEVPAASWPAWLATDPALAHDARCDAMVRALRAHGVGRPRPADVADAMDPLTRSRHDLELLFPRRAEQYRSMAYLGTVADLTEARFADLQRWLDEPVAVTP